MSYTHLTTEERKKIQELLAENKSFRYIAGILNRSPSTISREVKRNKAKYRPRKVLNSYWYNHWNAYKQYIARRRNKKRRKLIPDTEEWDYIIYGLEQYWSPETICSRWSITHPGKEFVSYTTIYRYIYKLELPGIRKRSHLRRKGKKYVNRNANYNTIQPDRIIPEWAEEINERLRIGDWEGDTVLGGTGKGGLVTLVDRKSRYVRIGLIQTKKASEVRAVLEQLLEDMPVKSISLDNGAEFAQFREMEENLETEVYFAEPHKPWQRGTNENTNGIIRFFYPKGCDFRKVTEEEVAKVEALLNNRPRKCLGWRTPAEVFFEQCVALA